MDGEGNMIYDKEGMPTVIMGQQRRRFARPAQTSIHYFPRYKVSVFRDGGCKNAISPLFSHHRAPT